MLIKSACLLAYIIIGEAYTSRHCDYSGLPGVGRVSTIAPAKMNGSKPNLAGRNYVSKGTNKKIWAPIACVAPPRGGLDFFLSVHMSPVRLTLS